MSILIGIDAGHSYDTPGKRTFDGYREHTANTRMAYWFDKAARRCGFKTLKVAWDDGDGTDDKGEVSLSTRQRKIRNAGCDSSVSFHYNHSGGKTWDNAQGIETFYHSSNPGNSKKLANAVQKNLEKGTPQKSRGVKTAAFAMVNCATMHTKASILIEAGFMSNKYETELMKNDKFLKECAEETCKGFCEYYGVKYIPETKEEPKKEEHKKEETKKEEPKKDNKTFQVIVKVSDLNIRKGPGTEYKVVGSIKDKGKYTIVETKGSWGRLKSGAGWINCSEKYCKRA